MARIGGVPSATMVQNIADSVADSMRQHHDVVLGHDAVHPDRNDCGGVGGCALMRAEHDVERDIIRALQGASRANVALTVQVI